MSNGNSTQVINDYSVKSKLNAAKGIIVVGLTPLVVFFILNMVWGTTKVVKSGEKCQAVITQIIKEEHESDDGTTISHTAYITINDETSSFDGNEYKLNKYSKAFFEGKEITVYANSDKAVSIEEVTFINFFKICGIAIIAIGILQIFLAIIRLLVNIIAVGVIVKQTNNYENGLFEQQNNSDIDFDNKQ